MPASPFFYMQIFKNNLHLKFICLTSLLLLGTAAQADQIRYQCSGSTTNYSSWGVREQQISGLANDPLVVEVDTVKKTISFQTPYSGPVTATLVESAQWYDGAVAVNKPIMQRKLAQVSVRVGRQAWSAMTLYTLDNPDGESHLAFAGICVRE